MEKCELHDEMMETLDRIEGKIDGLNVVSILNGENTHLTFNRNEFHQRTYNAITKLDDENKRKALNDKIFGKGWKIVLGIFVIIQIAVLVKEFWK